MERESELALVSRLRAGDPRAFDEVYAAFNVRLFTFLVRLSRRRDVAEDLLEDTWLRFIRKVESLRPDTTLAAWLFTIARNRYFSYCRARAIDEAHAAGLLAFFSSASGPSPFELTASNETERRVETALASLPPTYREVLLLVGVEGLTPAEAARVCGVSKETLRQRLHRARTMLARRLNRDDLPHIALSEVTT